MSIEDLRRAVEAQERYVTALRRQKERRVALLQQIRAAMASAEPISGAALCELAAALAAAAERPPSPFGPEPTAAASAQTGQRQRRRRKGKGGEEAWMVALRAFAPETAEGAAEQRGEPQWFLEMTAEEAVKSSEERQKEEKDAEVKKRDKEREEYYSDDFEELSEG